MLATVVLPIVLAFIMFSLGIGLTLKDFGRVLTRPRAVLIGATAQMLVLPIIAFVLLLFFDLPPAFKVGVMILSFVPGGTTLNMITNLARGDVALSVTLRTLTCRPIGCARLKAVPGGMKRFSQQSPRAVPSPLRSARATAALPSNPTRNCVRSSPTLTARLP